MTLTHNKILFVFSDPGGAKPCLAMITLLNRQDITVISDRSYPFYSSFNQEVVLFNKNPADFLRKNQFDLIVTGTSYTSNLELNFIKVAREKNITCWSFIDHWTNFKERFINEIGELILPDRILVIDERAKKIAISEGINKEIIVIVGNPYHEWLKKWRPPITRAQFYKDLELTVDKKIIVFAFDPLSNINGKKLYGFDEISVLQELSKISQDIVENHSDWVFLIKPHPNQDIRKLLSVVDKNQLFKIVPQELDSNNIIYFSDIIVGFFSSFLLESIIMNKVVVRVLPNGIKNDPLADMNIGTTVDVPNFFNLISKILDGYK